MAEEYEIEVYSTDTGKEPFTEWLRAFKDRRAQQTVLLRIQRIRQGNFGDVYTFRFKNWNGQKPTLGI